MTQKTASEKDMFLQMFQRECQTTLKLLKAFPANQAELRPHAKSRSAKELAWTFVMEQGFADQGLKGRIDFSQPSPPPPSNYTDIISAFENATRETTAKVNKISDDDLNRTLQFPVAPGKLGDVRKMDVLWTTLVDQIHHRGQFSVYMRLAGAKVPSIYGPSADEPWM